MPGVKDKVMQGVVTNNTEFDHLPAFVRQLRDLEDNHSGPSGHWLAYRDQNGAHCVLNGGTPEFRAHLIYTRKLEKRLEVLERLLNSSKPETSKDPGWNE